MQTAIITGATGQDGAYLTKLLLNKNYKIYAIKRRASSFNTGRIDQLINDPKYENQLELVYGDLADYGSILNLTNDVKPDLFFNLGAQSHVAVSFLIPEYTADIVGTGVIRCLEAIKKSSPKTKFLTASSSEMFGGAKAPQDEKTPFYPKSPYAAAKAFGFYLCQNYREQGLHASNSICFNHESPLRSETMLPRKLTRAATRIKLGLQKYLYVGNTKSFRDWGHAEDYCRAMISILELDYSDDFVVATGEMHSVQELIEIVFGILDLDWKEHVRIDQKFYRPTEVDELCGISDKLRKATGWAPKYSFMELVQEMVDSDMKLALNEKLILEQGSK